MPGATRSMLVFITLLIFVAIVFAQSGTKATTPNSADLPSAGTTKPPVAKVEVVEDDLHGHKIADPYRYMENAENPDTQAYVRAEAAYTRSILDPLPGREKINRRLTELLAIGTLETPQMGGNYYFHRRREGSQNQPVLYVREGLNGADRVLVDPNQLAADGTTAIDWWFASHDGKYVAYGLSTSGSEESVLHVIETATGRILPDAIPGTRFSSIGWKSDDTGFYYTRHPQKGEVPAGEEVYHVKVFYHPMGDDPAKDPLVFGENLKPQDYPGIVLSEDDRWLVITVSQGWAKTELWLKDVKANTPAVPVMTGKDFIYNGDVYGGKLYILTNEGAPRFRVFTVDAANPAREQWKEIIPQSDAVLEETHTIGGKIFARYQKNASSQLKLFALDGKHLADPPLPGIGTVVGVGGNYDSKEALYDFNSYTVPPTIYHYDLASNKTSEWVKIKAPIDSSAYQVEQVWFNSKDGTRVPMFLVSKKGLERNGKNPTLLSGYGGFNVGRTPVFKRELYVWLEHGGIYADVTLRGGNEFGEDWHRAGMLQNKQNVFDDFAGAAEYLIAQKYTDSNHLAIQGGSNGGLLMGAAFTQHPELYRAVICQVPLLDMLRYQNFLIAKLWIPEYGVADDANQFKWLYAYSPYHHVKEGTLYPAIMFMTADTDTRVDPMHAKKMAALMQAKAANGQSHERPILLRIEPKAGHGAGKPVSKLIEEGTDVWSFLFWQLGVKP